MLRCCFVDNGIRRRLGGNSRKVIENNRVGRSAASPRLENTHPAAKKVENTNPAAKKVENRENQRIEGETLGKR